MSMRIEIIIIIQWKNILFFFLINYYFVVIFLILGVVGGFFGIKYAFRNDEFSNVMFENEKLMKEFGENYDKAFEEKYGKLGFLILNGDVPDHSGRIENFDKDKIINAILKASFCITLFLISIMACGLFTSMSSIF